MRDLILKLRLRFWRFYSIFQVNRIMAIVAVLLAAILFGSLYLYFTEWVITGGKSRDSFCSLRESVWSIFVYFFSGLEDDYEPATLPGKIGAILIMIISVGTIGLFTGNIAAILFEKSKNKNIMKKKPPKITFNKHIIFLGWSETTRNILLMLNSCKGLEKRLFLIVEEKDDIILEREDLPYHIYHVPGDFTKEDALLKADIRNCSKCIIIYSGQDEYNDSLLLASYTARMLSGNGRITVLLHNNHNTGIIEKYADEIVSNDSLIAKLLSQSAITAGINPVWGRLLDPEGPGIGFYEIPQNLWKYTYRDLLARMETIFAGKRIIPIGYFDTRSNRSMINPRGGLESAEMENFHRLIIIKG